jgi:tetratricopeptide (TPR) repeat protein
VSDLRDMKRQAFAAFTKQDFAEAERLCREILTADPDNFDAHHLMGGLRAHQGDWDGAITHFDRAVALRPTDLDARENRNKAVGSLLERAIGLSKERHFDAALAHFDLVVRSEPKLATAWNNRGNALLGMGRYDAAMASYERALELDPGLVLARSNRGNMLSRFGRFAEALTECDFVLQHAPQEAAAHHNRANALRALRQYDEALLAYRRAIKFDPDLGEARVNYAMLRLQLGGFVTAAPDFEWRWKLAGYPAMRAFDAPQWTGTEDIAGKRLLVHGEQGQGDMIQFARFTKLLAARDAKVILETPPACVRLFGSLEDEPEILRFGDPLPKTDFHIPIMSLLGALGVTVATIPAPRRYLTPPPDVASAWRAKMGTSDKTRVGIVWSGNPAHHNDFLRSMPRELMEGLGGPGIELVPLQKELRDDLTDFADTAALIDCLDLVITVDTSVAHLAGALGAETWILIPYAPDWRWMNERTDSPWYPSATLYRQDAPADWQGVTERVRRDLSRIVGRGARSG